MTDSRRQLPSGARSSAWGQTHLALDALVAFVDDELSPVARRRALTHLAGCTDCAAEVIAQTQARIALRTGTAPTASSSLLLSLRAIPDRTELPAAPAGLAVAADGRLVAPRPEPVRRPTMDRRARVGAGAVVSGLALGALVLTGTSGSASPGPVRTAPGSVVPGSVVDARLQLGGVRDTADESVRAAVGRAAARQDQQPTTRKLAHQRWYR